MSEEKKAPIFVEGLNVKMPSDKAPDYILLQMGFNATKFFRWCQNNQDEKGWVNVTIKRSKNGTLYGELDTWKPTKQEAVEASVDKALEAEYNEAMSLDDIQSKEEIDRAYKTLDKETGREISLDDIPF